MQTDYTSERVEAGDLIGRELSWIAEELLEANGLSVAAIVQELVEELECRQQVVLFQQEVHHTITERRSLNVHNQDSIEQSNKGSAKFSHGPNQLLMSKLRYGYRYR